MLDLVLWMVVGTVIGWLANYGMHNRVGTRLDIGIGIVGALLGGLVFGEGMLSQNVFSPIALLAAYFSAVALLILVKLMRTGARPA
jgi:uncharacterized membrane protein YeaQ/YmgE (transglycosylase-associated protein family)